MTDVTYDVVAITDGTGAVVERFLYDPYGKSTVLDPNFAFDSDSLSDYDWETRFTSREFDKETGLDYFRARYWGSHVAQFLGRDPIGYPDGYNTYSGYFVPAWMDPSGLSNVDCTYETGRNGGFKRKKITVDCSNTSDGASCCEKNKPPGWRSGGWEVSGTISPPTPQPTYEEFFGPWDDDGNFDALDCCELGAYGTAATAGTLAGGVYALGAAGFETVSVSIGTDTVMGGTHWAWRTKSAWYHGMGRTGKFLPYLLPAEEAVSRYGFGGRWNTLSGIPVRCADSARGFIGHSTNCFTSTCRAVANGWTRGDVIIRE